MIPALNRFRRSVYVKVGDVICGGRMCVTMVKNPGVGIGAVVSAVDNDGGVHFMRWNGTRWENAG